MEARGTGNDIGTIDKVDLARADSAYVALLPTTNNSLDFLKDVSSAPDAENPELVGMDALLAGVCKLPSGYGISFEWDLSNRVTKRLSGLLRKVGPEVSVKRLGRGLKVSAIGASLGMLGDVVNEVLGLGLSVTSTPTIVTTFAP